MVARCYTVEPRNDPQWEPVPDVIATLKSIKDYPTEPVEIVVEIRSPDDKLMHIIRKCGSGADIYAGPGRKIRVAVEVGKPRSHYSIVVA
jgi:Uma2 family endonuclease